MTRNGGNLNQAVSVGYRIDFGPTANQLNTFPLTPGSDYATPGTDFGSVSGTLNWAKPSDAIAKTITIPIINDNLPEFNEDFQVQLFNASPTPTATTPGAEIGEISTATVTILYDDQPAGAVDRTWNQNNVSSSVPPFLNFPGTSGGVSDSANGNGGTVYAVVEQPDRQGHSRRQFYFL